MMASAIQRIQPRPPSASLTLPGAQPSCLARGARTPQPTSMPRFIDSVVGKPMMMPCPMYDRDGEKLCVRASEGGRSPSATGPLEGERGQGRAGRRTSTGSRSRGGRPERQRRAWQRRRGRGGSQTVGSQGARGVRWAVSRKAKGCSTRNTHGQAGAGRKAEAERAPAGAAHALELHALLLALVLVVRTVVRALLPVVHGQRPVVASAARGGGRGRRRLRVKDRDELRGCRSRGEDELLLDDLESESRKVAGRWSAAALDQGARRATGG